MFRTCDANGVTQDTWANSIEVQIKLDTTPPKRAWKIIKISKQFQLLCVWMYVRASTGSELKVLSNPLPGAFTLLCAAVSCCRQAVQYVTHSTVRIKSASFRNSEYVHTACIPMILAYSHAYGSIEV